MTKEFIELIGNYGMTLVICALFIWQYLKQIKYNEEREEKLYTVIEAMSQMLPDIKDKCEKILFTVRSDKSYE